MVTDVVKLRDIKPVLTGYLAESRELITKAPIPDEEAVHDIRVLMKKSRAVIRLLKGHLDEETLKKEYQAYREIGRILGSWRDTSIHRKTLRALKKTHPKLFEELAGEKTISDLVEKKQHVNEDVTASEKDIADVTDLINKSAFRLRFYTLDKLDPKLLLKELEVSYRLAAESYLKCRNTLKSSSVHEFRKRSKDFLYQLYFFRPLNPDAIKRLEKRLDVLTQNLGRYNDLTQLLKALDYHYDNAENKPALNELAVIIRNKQDEHIAGVWPDAYRVFCPGTVLVNLLGFKLLVI